MSKSLATYDLQHFALRATATVIRKNKRQTYSSVNLNFQVLGHYLQNALARDHSRDHPDNIALIVMITAIREKTGKAFSKAASLVKTHGNSSRCTCIVIFRSRSRLENMDNDQLREDDNGPSNDVRRKWIHTTFSIRRKAHTYTGRIITCQQQHNKHIYNTVAI